MRVLVSPAAEPRLRAARAFLKAHQPALVVADTRRAADELIHRLTLEQGATFGLRATSLDRLAEDLALPVLARNGLAPMSPLGLRALAARAAARTRGTPMDRVRDLPGFPAALARTLDDLRLGGTDPGGDLQPFADAAAELRREGRLADARDVLEAALEGWAESPLRGLPVLLLDVSLRSRPAADLARALAQAAPAAVATVPAGDEETLLLLQGEAETLGDEGPLQRLRRWLFSSDAPPEGEPDEATRFFSAPGEERECVEVARRLLAHARRGVPFDEMAVLLRAPETCSEPLHTALQRAGIPAWSTRGARRPDPSGRALAALLDCRLEGLSVRRFSEYLSLGQVPHDERDPGWVGPGEEEEEEPPPEGEDRQDPVSSPFQWERLLVEASVVGGAERWRRRLDGLQHELALRISRLDPDDPKRTRLEKDRGQLARLAEFALPVIETMAGWPERQDWAGWLRALERLAPRVLKEPKRVLGALATLRVMGELGPVALDEVRRALARQLLDLVAEPPVGRYGRVFVGTPDEVRGRSFQVVFVPGLAERVFPRRPDEDPLLPDSLREELGLPTRAHAAADERLRLRLALGAATRAVELSYPRMDVEGARARVPSFYALDIARAVRGRLPHFEELERAAEAEAGARLAWPAPRDQEQALDEAEHDLAAVDGWRARPHEERVGSLHYLLAESPALARSLRMRWMEGAPRWSPADGLTEPILAGQGLKERPYSVSALQRYAACPYRFLLASVLRLEPREEVEHPERMDPLTRGSLVHDVQARLLWSRELTSERLDRLLTTTADRFRDQVCPALPGVWQDEVEALRADLHLWLRGLLGQRPEWEPLHAELAFGLPGEAGRDPASRDEPVRLAEGWLLRGSVDQVDRGPNGVLRVTDHKTGRAGQGALVIGGGEVLQPVLYALAVERLLGAPVAEGRLYHCTSDADFAQRPVPLDAEARHAAGGLLQDIDGAVAGGRFPRAPRKDACEYCDVRPVCGPEAERTARRKPPLEDLRRWRDHR